MKRDMYHKGGMSGHEETRITKEGCRDVKRDMYHKGGMLGREERHVSQRRDVWM